MSIKFPSTILAVLAAVGMFLLVRAWARSNVAVIAALIGSTMPAFVFAAQDGTPHIFAVFASIWLLLAATYVARRKAPGLLWKMLLFSFFVLTLYTPLGIYLCLALLSAAIFHPHIRYVARRLNPNRVVASLIVGLLLVSPLLYSVVMQPQIGLGLIGWPSSWPDWWPHTQQFFGTLFGFGEQNDGILRPIIPIGIAMLMLVGLYRLHKTRYTARSYVMLAWMLLLLPLTYLNPEYVPILLPSIVILIAMGMATLIIEWYRLFPLNPYARVFGLLPLSFIVAGIVLSSVSRYSISYISSPDLVKTFHTDLSLLDQTLNRAEATTDNPIRVVVGEDNKAFYELTAKYDGRYTISLATPTEAPFVLIAGSGADPAPNIIPSHIAVTSRSNEANRIYLYKP